MYEQLEFDLVSPYLAGPGPAEERLLAEAAELLDLSREKILAAKIAAELQHQDLVLAPRATNELEELRLLIGPEAWKKSRRRWERRLKQNVTAFRKVLIVLRNLKTENLKPKL